MRRTFDTTAGCNPLASSSAMNRRSPLWMTFRILTWLAKHVVVRCQVTPYNTGRRRCGAVKSETAKGVALGDGTRQCLAARKNLS